MEHLLNLSSSDVICDVWSHWLLPLLSEVEGLSILEVGLLLHNLLRNLVEQEPDRLHVGVRGGFDVQEAPVLVLLLDAVL